jgi:hypothetical protein
VRSILAHLGTLTLAATLLAPAAPTHAATPLHAAPARAAEQATIKSAEIRFNTNDDDKDHDTKLRIEVVQGDGHLVAFKDDLFGKFPDQSERTITLDIEDESITKDQLRGGLIKLHITPLGSDTWKFDFKATIRFTDGGSLTARAHSVTLHQSHRDGEWGLI